ncbi:hypothetical protein F4806DRAFT_174659 [Annulohypoxylon nitens]|nr:hypothetical protein F4806DRAFT_174659 [Annulohypoxylon nitens]
MAYIDIRRSDGLWIFQLDGGIGIHELTHSSCGHYRFIPGCGKTLVELSEFDYFNSLFEHSEVVNASLRAFAQECSHIPSLEEAWLKVRHNDGEWHKELSIEIKNRLSMVQGMERWESIVNLYNVKYWRPTEDTLKELKNIGRLRGGQDSAVSYFS